MSKSYVSKPILQFERKSLNNVSKLTELTMLEPKLVSEPMEQPLGKTGTAAAAAAVDIAAAVAAAAVVQLIDMLEPEASGWPMDCIVGLAEPHMAPMALD